MLRTIDDIKLKNIADAIRRKNFKTDSYTVEAMVKAIDDLIVISNEPVWCEYLKTNGNQWLDFNYLVNEKSEIKITYLVNEFGKQRFCTILGCTDSPSATTANNGCIRLVGQLNRIGFGDSSTGNLANITDYNDLNNKYNAELKNGTAKITNLKTGESETVALDKANNFTSKYTLTICGRNSGKATPDFLMTGNIYSVEVSEGNTLYNLKPCLHPETLKPALYDTITKSYHYNQGGGEFGYKRLDTGAVVEPEAPKAMTLEEPIGNDIEGLEEGSTNVQYV